MQLCHYNHKHCVKNVVDSHFRSMTMAIRVFVTLVLFLSSSTYLGCSSLLYEDQVESIHNLTNVSLNIIKHLFSKKEYENKNVVFSPLSLHVVLSILAAGSEGPTQRQLLSFLRSKSTDHLNSLASYLISDVLSDASLAGGPHLSVANGVWVDQTLSLQPFFQQLVVSHYKATVASVDFKNKADEAIKEVNFWAEKETNGLIKNLLKRDLVESISITNLIFANALYFKGAWYEKFDASKTEDYDFHLLKGSSIKVPFMTSSRDQFISAFDGFKVLCLPYKKGKDKRQFSMCIFLPDAKDGLSTLIEKVANESGFLEHTLPHKKVKVGEFRIPRFNISFELEISNVLKEMGLVLPFIAGDLSKMVVVDSKHPQVSSIIQKSSIEVNEAGTVAATVSADIMVGCSLNTQTLTRIDFVADHPFLFLIRENLTGTVLFVGQVLNPVAGMDD